MRYIGKEDIKHIAMGAAVLGTGGGGDPYSGMLMAIQAIDEFGPIQLVSPDEVPDDALVVPSANMGAPTVDVEKISGGQSNIDAFRAFETYAGRKIDYTMPIEAGGGNSMVPFVVAAHMGIPIIDADGMGRAFPELQMVTFYLNGIEPSPMAMADEKGNKMLLESINGLFTEKIGRSVTSTLGGSLSLAIYAMTGKQVKDSAIFHTVTLSQQIGEILAHGETNKQNPLTDLLKLLNGYHLFSGKITDVERKTVEGFARGTVSFDGLDTFIDSKAWMEFQNENLILTVDDDVACTTPDLIICLDAETSLPITTSDLRYGSRCTIIGVPSDSKWRTQDAINLVGPRYFKYDDDFVPIEDLQSVASIKNNKGGHVHD